ncbi:MAG: hypothetical protein ACYDAG_15970 [Chloroflexota bacterium]
MALLTRRKFLGWTSAGLAGVGVVALVPRLVAGDTTAGDTTAADSQSPVMGTQTAPAKPGILAAQSSEPLFAYVRNAAAGEITFMSGTREITRQDPELVARLFRGVR